MHLKGIDYVFWLYGYAVHWVLFVELFVRRRAKIFPFFTSYIVLSLVRTTALYYIFLHVGRDAYFYVYWSFGLVDVLIQLGIFFEMATKVFRPTGKWAPDVKKSFLIMATLSCLFASALTWWCSPVGPRPLQVVALRGSFFSSALLSELFLGVLMLSTWAGLPWKTHEARMSITLGFFSAIGLITEGAHSLPSSHNLAIFVFWSRVQIACYLLCATYWSIILWKDAPAPRELPEKLRIELAALNRLLEGDLGRIAAWRKQ